MAPQDNVTAGPIEDPDAYAVDLLVTQAADSSTWTYTITKTVKGAKDLGHFILNFDNCGERSPKLANIVSTRSSTA